MPLSATHWRSAMPASVWTPAEQNPSFGALVGSLNTQMEPTQQRAFKLEAPRRRVPSAREKRGGGRPRPHREGVSASLPCPALPHPPTCAVVRALQVPLHAGRRVGRDAPLGRGRAAAPSSRARRRLVLHRCGGGTGRGPHVRHEPAVPPPCRPSTRPLLSRDCREVSSRETLPAKDIVFVGYFPRDCPPFPV